MNDTEKILDAIEASGVVSIRGPGLYAKNERGEVGLVPPNETPLFVQDFNALYRGSPIVETWWVDGEGKRL